MDPAAPRANLHRLFAPRSIAVVGASASPDKAGYQAVDALGTFNGEIFPVNPKPADILGHQTYPSLRAIGRPVDLVIFAIPAAACVEGVREAIACACGGGLIVSGGFAESGHEGAKLQTEIEALCKASGFRLLGPNTAGFVNSDVSLTATFAAGTNHMRSGRVAVVAQSSGINFLVAYAIGRLGGGVSCAIGVGNAIDIDVADALEFLADDERTAAIALHLEGIPNGRRLVETLRRVTRRKPVAALIVGREDIGDFAQSHTGKLVGSYDLKLAALAQAGVVTVATTEELAAAATLLSANRLPPTQAPGLGVITGQGGAGLIMLDWLKSAGVRVPPLRETTIQRIREMLPPMTYLSNPVDTARPSANFPDVIATLASDEQIDAVIVFALPERAILEPRKFVPELRQRIGKPLVFGTGGAEAEIGATVRGLRAAGVFGAESPEELARAAIVIARDATLQWQLQRNAVTPGRSSKDVLPTDDVDEDTAKGLLDTLGIATPARRACRTRAEALAAFRALDKPVVAKILAREIGHKTEAGGVHLNLSDETALALALDALEAIPLRGARRFLIEAMAPPGLELIVGAVRDPSFGPTIMVGIGGTVAEAIKDTVTRLAPIAAPEAHEMLGALRAAALLDGWRGSPPIDRAAVADAIVRLSAVLDAYPHISEIEINPLRAYAAGVLALDALIV